MGLSLIALPLKKMNIKISVTAGDTLRKNVPMSYIEYILKRTNKLFKCYITSEADKDWDASFLLLNSSNLMIFFRFSLFFLLSERSGNNMLPTKLDNLVLLHPVSPIRENIFFEKACVCNSRLVKIVRKSRL